MGLLLRGLVVGGDLVADLVADPAPALMGGDQRALMAQDPSVHQGASAVLLLATTAPRRSARTEVLHRSQRSQDPALTEAPRAVVEPQPLPEPQPEIEAALVNNLASVP